MFRDFISFLGIIACHASKAEEEEEQKAVKCFLAVQLLTDGRKMTGEQPRKSYVSLRILPALGEEVYGNRRKHIYFCCLKSCHHFEVLGLFLEQLKLSIVLNDLPLNGVRIEHFFNREISNRQT